MKGEKQDDCYQEGWDAYHAGQDISCNPYPPFSDEAEDWANGLLCAEDMDRDEM